MTKCDYCGEDVDDDDIIDGLCEDCDSVWCTVCKQSMHEDSTDRHRHLFYDDDNGQWLGVGGPDMTDHHYELFKHSLFAVLDKTGLARHLALTIERGEMGFDRFHFQGTTMGYTSIWCSLRNADVIDPYDGKPDLLFCGERFTDGLTDELEEEMAYGVNWLIGLENNEETPEANQRTLGWINEYLNPVSSNK